jgi:glycosyltransferase involved in cell wall biosynthesis
VEGLGLTPVKVVICIPTYSRPLDACLAAVEASVPLLGAAGIDHSIVFEVGSPYISAARATMLRKALDAGAEVVVFIDHDLSWDPQDLLTLIQTPGDVVAGTYRFKSDDGEDYMGAYEPDAVGRPVARDDGCIKANRIPAGFLKVTKDAVRDFMLAYPQLCYGPPYNLSVDLFNHGAHKGVWYGEDYAFSRNWREIGGEIWLIPDLNLTHHNADKAYPGNYHRYLLRQPGGSEGPALEEAA